MFKIILLFTLVLVSCSTPKPPTAKEKVQNLQKMCLDATPSIKERQAKKSLYERLGKREGIRKFFEHLLPAHRANKKIAHLFKYSDDKKVIAHSTDFLTVGSGGPGQYTGRNMKDVHAHLKIKSADFLEAGKDVKETMQKLGYGENEIQEVTCALVSFIPQVLVDIN